MNNQIDGNLIINGSTGRQAIMDSIGGGDNRPAKQFASTKTVYITPEQHKEKIEAPEMYRGIQKQRTANGKYPPYVLNNDGSATSLDYQLLDLEREIAYVVEYYPNREAKETKDMSGLLTCYIFDTHFMAQLKRLSVTAEERKGRYPAFQKDGLEIEFDIYLIATLSQIQGEEVFKLKKKAGIIRGDFFKDPKAKND